MKVCRFRHPVGVPAATTSDSRTFKDLMFKILLGLAGALSVAGAAAAQPPSDPNRLFADSKLVVRDRFSDEIVGKGPDLVLIPGLASSRATWKATAERLPGH